MGGAFDPIHYGHMILAEKAAEAFELDGVLFVPTFMPPHREDKPKAEFADRVRMTELAVNGRENFIVSDLEKEIDTPSYTLGTVERLKEKFPECRWSLILGADNLVYFSSWHKPEEIVRSADIVVGRRPGYEIDPPESEWAGYVQWFEMPVIGISSTDIRKSLQHGRSVRYMIPEPVRRYIIEKGLYR
jgi:nicotinate-nucleotide adenylyltransferase